MKGQRQVSWRAQLVKWVLQITSNFQIKERGTDPGAGNNAGAVTGCEEAWCAESQGRSGGRNGAGGTRCPLQVQCSPGERVDTEARSVVAFYAMLRNTATF